MRPYFNYLAAETVAVAIHEDKKVIAAAADRRQQQKQQQQNIHTISEFHFSPAYRLWWYDINGPLIKYAAQLHATAKRIQQQQQQQPTCTHAAMHVSRQLAPLRMCSQQAASIRYK